MVGFLDAELRYLPALRAIPDRLDLPICEIGSGPVGLAAWTVRTVIGIDPGDDHRHRSMVTEPPNLVRKRTSGASIPLATNSVAAAVAVDTLEHVPLAERQNVVEEMARVTAPGGKIITVGPVGEAAGAGDHWLISHARAARPEPFWAAWLEEHVEYGLPTLEELTSYMFASGATRITASGVFNIGLWQMMHLSTLGELPHLRGRLYDLVWRPFGAFARRYRRGPFYRWIVVGYL